jgi:hypothetical protein
MTETVPPTPSELSIIIDGMIESINRLPPHAMVMPITNYDHLSILFLIKSLLSSLTRNQGKSLSDLQTEATDLGSVSDLVDRGNSSSTAVTLP